VHLAGPICAQSSVGGVLSRINCDPPLVRKSARRKIPYQLPGMKSLTYHQRLTKLDLDSLEVRRIWADVIFAYKLIFGLTDINPSEFFYCTGR